MFTLNPLPPQIAASLVQKLVRAEPATIGHFRHWGFMDPGLRAMQQDVRIAGPAVTVHQPGVDGTIIGYALGQLRPGDVLVVDRCGDMRHAGFGGVVAYAAKVAKVAGVIIADECGVVVMDPADAEAAADRAIAMQEAESKTRARLDAGEKLPDISGATKVLEEALAKQKG